MPRPLACHAPLLLVYSKLRPPPPLPCPAGFIIAVFAGGCSLRSLRPGHTKRLPALAKRITFCVCWAKGRECVWEGGNKREGGVRERGSMGSSQATIVIGIMAKLTCSGQWDYQSSLAALLATSF